MVFQGCLKGVPRVSLRCSRVSQWCFNGVSRVFLGVKAPLELAHVKKKFQNS